ncbi:hypothetical protein ACEPAG_1866 [Sanghuangporus baumii]
MTPNAPTGTHSHSAYYDENEIASASRHVSHSRNYDQVHNQHEFQTRLTQTTDPADSVGAAAAGEGAMFYAPSNFAPTRMSAHQYSAAPTSSGTAYQPQTSYLDADPSPPSATSTTSAYYTGAQIQGHSQTQYTVTPVSSLNSDLNTNTHAQDLSPVLLSAEHPSHASSGPISNSSVPSATATRSARPTDPPSPTNINARRHTTADIGKWKMFASGPFMGRMVRAEIKEVQKADLGRKCADPPTGSSAHGSHHGGNGTGSGSGAGPEGETTDATGGRRGKEKEHQNSRDGNVKENHSETKAVRKDRRPLDPPPVVELKFFESIHRGTPHEYERPIPAEEVEIGGLICQVDLFRVTIPPSPTEVASLTLQAHAGGIGPVHSGQAFGYGTGAASLGLQSHAHGLPGQSPYEQHGFAYPPNPSARRQSLLGTEENASGASPLDAGWESASPVSPVSPYTYHRHPPPHHVPVHPHTLPTLNTHVPTLHNINSPSLDAPIDPDSLPLPSESDKLSRVLFGESYSHACSILDLHGRPVLYFVFSDLSVKLEGLFRPRYRFFDLFSRTSEGPDVPILAQCFGGAFAVYSTKEFPGLKASTPLTKHLSRWGIRVNIRETERKRRAPDGNGGNGSSNAGSSTGKEKKRGGNGGGGRKARGGSVAGSIGAGGASSSASVREDEDADERGGSMSSPVATSRIIDAPKRYLEGAARGRGRARSTAAGGGGEARGRGKSRGD